MEVSFTDFKELLGSDQCQVRSVQAIVRCWTLVVCLYQYLDEQRPHLQAEQDQLVTLGQAHAWVRERHRACLGTIFARKYTLRAVVLSDLRKWSRDGCLEKEFIIDWGEGGSWI